MRRIRMDEHGIVTIYALYAIILSRRRWQKEFYGYICEPNLDC